MSSGAVLDESVKMLILICLKLLFSVTSLESLEAAITAY